MTDMKRKAGRPPLPPPPQNADDCRRLIAAEIVKQNPKAWTLRQYHRLLKSFEREQDAELARKKIEAQETANRIAADALRLRKEEYRRRFAAGPLGQRTLLIENESLRQRVIELEVLNSGSVPTLARRDGQVAQC